MKTKLMGMFALLIIALSVAGFAYAHWSEIIKINGIVEMGSLTIGFTRIVAEWDKEDWLDYYGLPTKDVGTVMCTLDEIYMDVHTNKTVYKKLHCVLNNSYGTYWAINKFTTDNAGTVALVIKAITITYDPAVLAVREVIPGIEWEFTDIVENATAFNVWLYKEPEDYGPGWAIDPPWDFPGPVGDPFGVRSLIDNQIDPCNELLTEICVDVKQTAPECHTYLFDIEIYAENWDP